MDSLYKNAYRTMFDHVCHMLETYYMKNMDSGNLERILAQKLMIDE